MGQHVSQQANMLIRKWLRLFEHEVGGDCRRSVERGRALSLDQRVLLGEEPAGGVWIVRWRRTSRRHRGEKRGKGDLDESDRHLVKADFRYDEEQDDFHCPGGQIA